MTAVVTKLNAFIVVLSRNIY